MGGHAFELREVVVANLLRLRTWSQVTFEIPDVVHFADYAFCQDAFARELLERVGDPDVGRLIHFPFPNRPGKLRSLAIAEVHDLVRLRVLAGRVAAKTEHLLSPCVWSSRVTRDGRAWAYREHGPAFRKYRDRAFRLLRRPDVGAMIGTDVEQYYASVALDLLVQAMGRWDCGPEVVEGIVRILRVWQQRDGLHGLPIGPEGSGVLGNAFLMPVDKAIIGAGVEYLRWMDDLLAFAHRVEDCCAALDAADEVMQQLGLRRSREKTKLFEDLEEAREEVRDGLLVSLGSTLRGDRNLGALAVRKAFDSYLRGRGDAEPHRFRYIVRALDNLGDDYAARPLAECPASMNIDPKCSTDYLESVGLDDDRVVASMLGKLEAVPEDRTEALDLHSLRAMSTRVWGDAEALSSRRSRPMMRGDPPCALGPSKR